MILAALLFGILPQAALDAAPAIVQAQAPGTQGQGAAEVEAKRRKDWWEQLSPEEQTEMRQRMERMRAMPEASRESMKKRRELVKEEEAFVIEHLSPEERTAYEAMSERERKRFLRPRVHQRLRERGEDLRARFPKVGKDRRAFEEARRPQVEEGIAKALEDGWIGEATAAWLKRAPLHESMQVLMEVQKWQFLEQASRGGFWEEHGLDDEAQRHLTEKPASKFFREIRELRDGNGGPPGFRGRGPHDGMEGHEDRPGREGRDRGRGQPGERGFEEGRRPGQRPPKGRHGPGPPPPPREDDPR